MGRASRRKRNRIDPASAEGRLAARIAARLGNVSFRNPNERPPGFSPLSERLAAIMAPYRHEATSLHKYRVLAEIAVLAWNVSTLPQGEYERQIAEGIRRADLPDPDMFRDILRVLIHRKKTLFPDDARLIAGHEVSSTARGFHLVVASANLGAV